MRKQSKKRKVLKLNGNSNSKVERTTAGLRNALFDELEALRSGESDPPKSRATALLANTILTSVQVEVEFHKYLLERDVVVSQSAETPVLSLGSKAIALST